MDFNKKIVLKSWNQGAAGLKSTTSNVSTGNFRLVYNLGLLNNHDKTTNTNHKWVSDSSDYTRFKTLLMKHKSLISPSQ